MKYYIGILFSFHLLCKNSDGETYWTDDPFATPVEFDNLDDAEDFQDNISRITGRKTCVVQSEPND